jgi:protein translocase subunit secA
MDKLGLEEGEVIQHPWISKSIERAQKRMELNNFGIRKRLLEYDDVMNLQRERIYDRRRHALFGEKMEEDIAEMVQGTCEAMAEEFANTNDWDGFRDAVLYTFSMEPTIDRTAFAQASRGELLELLKKMVWERYEQRMATIAQRALPVFQKVLDTHGDRYTDVVTPISDGKRVLQIPINLRRAIDSNGRELSKGIARTILLLAIDDHWQQHLLAMDELKQSVQNASYEQKDPLLIYKFEGFELFERMISELNRDILRTLLKAHIPVDEGNAAQEPARQEQPKRPAQKLQAGRSDTYTSNAQPPQPNQPVVNSDPKVGRNDPCPCGSGKKYKNCHGRLGNA